MGILTNTTRTEFRNTTFGPRQPDGERGTVWYYIHRNILPETYNSRESNDGDPLRNMYERRKKTTKTNRILSLCIVCSLPSSFLLYRYIPCA